MEYIKATKKDTENIYELVQDTIRTVYPKYYPREVVDFFCEQHSLKKIIEDVENGYGSYIMQCLEKHIGKEHDFVYLDASLPAVHLYEKRRYTIVKHEKWPVENGVVLVYEVMGKRID